MSDRLPAETDWQRLHPLSPVLRGIKTLWLVIAAISWQGFARFGIGTGAAVVAAGGIAALAWSWVAWHFTGYEVTGRELRIRDGVLSRRHRTIRLARLQSVEVVQPLLARLLGLAELRCEVVGASRTEAPLAYLTLDDATRLRARLLTLSRRLDETADQPMPSGAPDETPRSEPAPVLRLETRRLMIAQLLTPQVLGVPVAAAATIGLFWWQPDMTFFGVAGLVTATAGTLLKPVKDALNDYGFTLWDTSDGIRIRRGLTEQRTQTLPPDRVTAVMVEWPLLWRGKRWVRTQVANAGSPAASRSGELPTSNGILPVGTVGEATEVVRYALPGVDMFGVALHPAPARARWCAPVGQPGLGATLTERAFLVRSGRVVPRLIAVPYARIQGVRVTQGRIARAARLASVHVDIAGGLGVATAAKHRDVTEALRLAEALRQRARVAAGSIGAVDDPANELDPFVH